MKWYPVELHTHTEHSDGDFTVAELVHAAKTRGFQAVALTDHNTASGQKKLMKAAEQEKLVPVHGFEWTTYWGHMLVLCEQGYTDWRGVKPEQIDAAIQSIHSNDGIVGIAHPFALSNPVNTGYQWEFQISDWSQVDYLEVWSRQDAPVKIQSYRAMKMWEDLLNQGYHITATSGRDWHREDTNAYAHTYVGSEQPLSETVIRDAIRAGRICLAAGPLLTMTAKRGDECFAIGQKTQAGEISLHLNLDSETLPHDWNREEVIPQYIRITANGSEIAKLPLAEAQSLTINAETGWLRADLMGSFYGREEQILALTNPLYFI